VKPLIVIPTLNEIDNIAQLLNDILKQEYDADILVVDARSEDGTPQIVKKISEKHAQVHLITQEERGNFGGAIRLGFEYALQHDYDPVITMDGDRAQNPAHVQRFLDLCGRYDMIIGSRYVDGVRVEGWRFRKLLISKLANMYISYVMVKPIWDFTSGFRCYRSSFLKKIDLKELPAAAYIFQIQMIYLAYAHRCRIKEIPTLFRGKLDAPSKVSNHTWWKTLFYVLKYRAPFLEILRHLAYLKKEYERFVEEYEELLGPPSLKNEGRFEVKKSYTVSVGIMAYNEEQIIGKCIKAIQDQQMTHGTIEEIIVISSGSTDGTDELVWSMGQNDARVRLITQPSRRGKANAINEFLRVASGDIVVIESADTVTEANTVDEMVRFFLDEQVGMVGAHPIPVNDRKTFVGYCVHRLWELHHLMASQRPKCGEMIAFRNILGHIPNYTAVDEATIESIIHEVGLELRYAAQAIVHNKGPETLSDFIKQRRRIASGHRHLQATMGYEVASADKGSILKNILRTQRWNPKEVFFMTLLIVIELYARMMGTLDFYLKDKNPFIWDISLTTKKM